MSSESVHRSEWTSEVAPLVGFRPDIQGLRGIAVLAVVLYHAGVILPGGYVGVDMFFVLSGFVIGRLLLAELDTTGDLAFRSFYIRRARRLLPALGLMLAMVVLLAPLLGPTGSSAVTPRTGIAAALFSANAYLYRVTSIGYFGPAAELNPLLHTWSLSVEEQFYFVMPALVRIAWNLGTKRGRSLFTLRVAVGGVFAISLILCVVLSSAGSVGPISGLRFAFFSPFTRAWQFAAGLSLVLMPIRWFGRAPLRRAAMSIGVTLAGASMFLFSTETLFPGVAALAPTFGTALLIYGGTSPDTGAPTGPHWLSWRPLVWLGNLSYSWYLWHWPLIVFAGAFWPRAGPLPLVGAAAVSLAVASVSYRFVEHRLRANPTTRTRSTFVLAACCIAAPLAAAPLAVSLNARISSRQEVTEFSSSLQLHAGWVAGCLSEIPLGDRPEGSCTWGSPGAHGSIVLIGDSNADQFSEALIGAAQRANMDLRIVAMRSCPFVVDIIVVPIDEDPESCLRFVRESLEYLTANPSDVVVIANATDAYMDSGRASMTDPSTGLRVDDGEKATLFADGLERAASQLQSVGSRVVIVNVVPKPWDRQWEPRECSNLLLVTDSGGCLFPSFVMSEQASLITANTIENEAAQRAGAEAWNFNTDICPADLCVSWRDGALVWRDYGHISVATSQALAESASRYLMATTLQKHA